MNFNIKSFAQLSAAELHECYQLRVAIFVVEQTCCYQEVDDLDKHPETRHVMLWDGDVLAAYARTMAPGTSYNDYVSIGRIALTQKYRGKGLGHELVAESIRVCQQHWPGSDIKISAQAHLQDFYRKHGFITVSQEYLEDGIPHIAMLRKTL